MAVVVITGGTAGVGKATALCFAKAGYDVAVIARDEAGLQQTQRALSERKVRALSVSADVADSEALEHAVLTIERKLGPIEVWVNNAMCATLAPFQALSAQEFQRVTEVTYLGCVNGTRAALSVMTLRNRGLIIQVGSALAYRSIPLQSAYCGAKAAIRGFTDAVRTELMHENSRIQIAMVQLPGINTPQFDWVRNKFSRRMRPVAPVFEPEVAARAILGVARRPVRELWVGSSTLQSIIGQFFFPRWLDKLMVEKAWEGQMTDELHVRETPDNLVSPVSVLHQTRGRFSKGAKRHAFSVSASLPGKALLGTGALVLAGVLARALTRRR